MHKLDLRTLRATVVVWKLKKWWWTLQDGNQQLKSQTHRALRYEQTYEPPIILKLLPKKYKFLVSTFILPLALTFNIMSYLSIASSHNGWSSHTVPSSRCFAKAPSSFIKPTFSSAGGLKIHINAASGASIFKSLSSSSMLLTFLDDFLNQTNHHPALNLSELVCFVRVYSPFWNATGVASIPKSISPSPS